RRRRRLARSRLSQAARHRGVAPGRAARAARFARGVAGRRERSCAAIGRHGECTHDGPDDIPRTGLRLMHRALIDAMHRQPAYAELRARLPAPAGVTTASGLDGASASLLAAALADALPQRIWIVVAHAPAEA